MTKTREQKILKIIDDFNTGKIENFEKDLCWYLYNKLDIDIDLASIIDTLNLLACQGHRVYFKSQASVIVPAYTELMTKIKDDSQERADLIDKILVASEYDRRDSDTTEQEVIEYLSTRTTAQLRRLSSNQ